MAIQQRADLLEANISANKMSVPQGQSYDEKEYCDGLFQSSSGLFERLWLMVCTNVFNLRTRWSEPQYRDRTANDHKWHLTVTERGGQCAPIVIGLVSSILQG